MSGDLERAEELLAGEIGSRERRRGRARRWLKPKPLFPPDDDTDNKDEDIA